MTTCVAQSGLGKDQTAFSFKTSRVEAVVELEELLLDRGGGIPGSRGLKNS